MTAKLYTLDDRRLPNQVDCEAIAKKLCEKTVNALKQRGRIHVCGENYHWLMPGDRCPHCFAENIE